MNVPKFRLLIADDEYWVREKLANLLDWPSLMISLTDPAVDGEDALAKIEAERPDIVITDINMPFVSGNDLIRLVKKRYPRTAMIVLSGYNDFAFVRDALLCGAIDYLLKPISKNALMDAVEKSIAILGSDRAHEREKADLDEKLLRASSYMRDRELSELIAEEGPVPGTGSVVSDLELNLAGFSLVLVKMFGMSAASTKLAPDRTQEIKKVASEQVESSVVFYNLYVRNEVVVLTGLRGEKLVRACRDLPNRIEGYTGLRSRVAVSRFHFSFADLKDAYEEARFSLAMRPVSREASVTRAEESEKVAVRSRITPENENQLLFGLQSGNKRLVREVILNQIGISRCEQEGWLVAEVKQTIQYLAAVIFHHSGSGGASILAMENLRFLIDAALESQDIRETCSLLDQALDEAVEDSSTPGASESMRLTIRRVQSYIEEHYFRNLSLTSIAKVFRVERSYLSKSFKQVTGENLMLSIARIRIEKAQEYIRGEGPDGRDLSLTDISSLVGYEEYAYFNRVFRKITGSSPSEYKTSVERRVSR